MAPSLQSLACHAGPRCARLVLLHVTAFGLVASSVGHAQSLPVRMSPAEVPFGDSTGASWATLEGSGGQKFLTAVLRPKEAGPFPVVIVLHGSEGLTPAYLSIAADLARAGFLAVVGCWQAGDEEGDGTRLCREATPQARWVADPATNCGKELIAMARTLPGARADRIGLYGVSRGGHAALWAASTGAGVQAVVADAPAHTPMVNPRPAGTLDVLPGLSASLLMMHGTADAVIPVEQSREYERAARALGKPLVAVYFEGVGHVVSREPQSRTEARARATAFLREHLLR